MARSCQGCMGQRARVPECWCRCQTLRAWPLLPGSAMTTRRALVLCLTLSSIAGSAAAQVPPKEPPPLWDTQIGASFVGTSGNSDTSTFGADSRRCTAAGRSGRSKRPPARSARRTRARRRRSAIWGHAARKRALRRSSASRRATGRTGSLCRHRLPIDSRRRSELGARAHPRWTLDGLTARLESRIAHRRTGPSTIRTPCCSSSAGFRSARRATRRSASLYYPDFNIAAAYRIGSRSHRAGGDERAFRAEDRLPAALFERSGARFQEERQHGDRVDRVRWKSACSAGAVATPRIRGAVERGAGPRSRFAAHTFGILRVRPARIYLTTCGSGGTADALASGASPSNRVGVQIPASAPAPSLRK